MDENEKFSVNFAKVVEQKDFLEVTRLLASNMMSVPYITIGDFLQSISDDSLEKLIEISDDPDQERFEELVLISEMLATGEGLESANMELSTERTNQLCVFLVLESLKRKNLVKLHYHNMSFGEDFKDKIIAEKF